MAERRTALVTGSSRGLGRAIAAEFAAAGLAVGVHGRSAADVDASVAEIRRAGGTAEPLVADLSDPGRGPAALMSQAHSALGEIDVLVNNAADQRSAPLPDSDATLWVSMLEANVVAAAELTRLLMASHSDRARVSVVNVASVEALVAFPNHAVYAASKAAMVSFTAAAAVEYAPARVNAVAPGLVARAGLADEWPDGYAWWCRTAPLGRPVAPQEVAAVVHFLCGPAAAGVTGTCVPVDAGWSASARLDRL